MRTECAERIYLMKKNTKIIIIICAAVLIAAVAVFRGIAIHDKSIIRVAEENLSITDITIELQNTNVTVTVDEVLNKNDVECTALFSNNAGSIEINTTEIKEYNDRITISLLKTILFDKEIMLDVKISVVDTTAPEFTESIDEITITEGDELNILEHFKATDLSGDVNLSATEFNNSSAGEQTVIITAADKNNNSSTKEVKITVEPKEEVTTAPSKNNNDKNAENSGSSKSSNKSDNKSSTKNSSSSSSSGSLSGSSDSSSSNSEDKKPEVKNVSPKDVQSKVNAYIRSKGITVDSSMTSNNASWTGEIWASQERLNNGKALKRGKDEVDYIINMCGKDTILSMYCYFDGNDTLYILYW